MVLSQWAVFAMSANDQAEPPLKAGLAHKVVVPSPTSPEPAAGRVSLLHPMLQASQGRCFLWCICLLTPSMAGESQHQGSLRAPQSHGLMLGAAALPQQNQAAARWNIPAPSPKLLTSGPCLGLGLRGCFPVQDAHLEPIRHL